MSNSEMRANRRKQRDWDYVEYMIGSTNGTGTRRRAKAKKIAKVQANRCFRRVKGVNYDADPQW